MHVEMGEAELFSQSESFCKCTSKKDLSCSCGEEQQVNWTWNTNDITRQIVLSNENKDVRFHPGYSSGTAAIRGKFSCLPGHHYFWEIKMLTALYGTDVMVGVGTEKTQLHIYAYRFCSMLGQDENSWGYSYRGGVQHKGKFMKYGPRFGQGSIIGVHLDMCAGTIEYYHNRSPLGVAFYELGSRTLYPMVSSTAARSAMRVVSAVSYLPNLQLDCLLTIGKNRRLIKKLNDIPGLKSALSEFWWAMPYAKEVLNEDKLLALFEDDQLDKLFTGRSLRKRRADPTWNSIDGINLDTDEPQLVFTVLSILPSEA